MAMNIARVSCAGVFLLDAMLLAAQTGSSAPPQRPAQSNAGPPPAKAVRVITDLKGFHLDQAPKSTGNEIGAASRGGKSVLTLCAPTSGLASTLHPLFVWQMPRGSEGGTTFILLSEAGDVLYETDVNGSSLLYPADAPALVPGHSYSWKVSGSGLNKLPDPVQLTIEPRVAHDGSPSEAGSAGATDPLVRAQDALRKQLWYDAVAILVMGSGEHPERKDLAEQLDMMYRQVIPACASDPK